MKLRAGFSRRPRPIVKQGFTLTEILLVIALGAIIFAFTIPASVQFYRRQQVSDTAYLMREILRRARTQSRAILNNSTYGVRINTSTREITLFQGTSYATRNMAEDEVDIYPSTVSISMTSPEAVFSKLYGTSTIADTWTASVGGFSQSVSISNQGLIEQE